MEPEKTKSQGEQQAEQLQAMSQAFDPADYQKQRISELEAQRDMMGRDVAEQNLDMEHTMRDAKNQGNQGNMVMDEATGKMVIKTDDEMGGVAANYWWGQNEKEVLIKCHVASHIKSRHIMLKSASQSVKLIVEGTTICDGPLLRPIISDESTWSLDDAPDGQRLLTVTMTKATPSKGQEHWTSAIKGEAKVNKKKFGIATTTVNPNDPAEMKRVLEQLR